MDSSQAESTAAANRIVQALLVNTNVESFGVLHQMPFIEFRNEQADDVRLTFDADIVFHPLYHLQLGKGEQMLLGMNRINLKRVIKASCTCTSDLEIHFEDGSWFRICGTSEDGYEPWQISNGISVAEGGTCLIASSGSGYAIWGSAEE